MNLEGILLSERSQFAKVTYLYATSGSGKTMEMMNRSVVARSLRA